MIYKVFLTATYEAVTDICPGLVGDPKRQGGGLSHRGDWQGGGEKEGGAWLFRVIECAEY